MQKLSYWLLAGTALAAFTACEKPAPPPPDQAIYATYEQCLVDNPADQCKAALSSAQLAQRANAPVVPTKAACEVQYGAGHCETASSGSGFSPMMMGFMLGQLTSGGSGTYGPRYYPVYYSPSGAVYTGRNTVVTRLPPQQMTTVMRGGFQSAAPIHVTPMTSSGVQTRSASSYASFRSGGSVAGSRSYGGSFSGSTSRGGFGASAGAHGGFGGG